MYISWLDSAIWFSLHKILTGTGCFLICASQITLDLENVYSSKHVPCYFIYPRTLSYTADTNPLLQNCIAGKHCSQIFPCIFLLYPPPPQKKIQLKLQTLMRSVLYDGYESMYNELFFKVLLTSYLSIMQSVLHWYEWKLNFTKRCSMQTHNTKFNWNPSISFTVKYSDGGADTLSAFIICKECIKQWTLH